MKEKEFNPNVIDDSEFDEIDKTLGETTKQGSMGSQV